MTGKALSAKRIFGNKLTFTFALLGAVIMLFIFVPLMKTIFGASPDMLFEALLDEQVRNAIWLSIYTALLATVVGAVFGVPLAYLLARYHFPGKRTIEGLVDVPIVVPHTAAGIALLFVFGRNFFAGKVFNFLGITFIDSVAGIVIAVLFVSIPFLIDAAKEGFKSVDVRLEKVSRTLGASPLQSFFTVTLPLAWKSIFAGNIMMWARGISEFGAVMIIAYHPTVASILVADRFEAYGLNYARPVAALLILVCLVIFIGLRAFTYRSDKP
jgi:molybdate/tungstate transport system permease protein